MAVPPSFNPTVRFPEQLRLHPAPQDLGLIGVADEINETARLKDRPLLESILITMNGTILAGFGRWRLAVLEGRREVHCIEHPISEEEWLPFILYHHKPRRGWNAFVRIRLALTMESSLQKKALDNMRARGRFKGSANLPEAQHLDVRQQIAHTAGVGVRNVSNVKTILKTAHARVIAALREGTLTINAAMQFCKLPKSEQLERFIRRSEERETDKVIRRSTARPKEQTISIDGATILDGLRQQEARQPGSVVMRERPPLCQPNPKRPNQWCTLSPGRNPVARRPDWLTFTNGTMAKATTWRWKSFAWKEFRDITQPGLTLGLVQKNWAVRIGVILTAH